MYDRESSPLTRRLHYLLPSHPGPPPPSPLLLFSSYHTTHKTYNPPPPYTHTHTHPPTHSSSLPTPPRTHTHTHTTRPSIGVLIGVAAPPPAPLVLLFSPLLATVVRRAAAILFELWIGWGGWVGGWEKEASDLCRAPTQPPLARGSTGSFVLFFFGCEGRELGRVV